MCARFASTQLGSSAPSVRSRRRRAGAWSTGEACFPSARSANVSTVIERRFSEFSQSSAAAGATIPPGTLRAPEGAISSSFDVVAYNKERCVEVDGADVDQMLALMDEGLLVWANVIGLGTVELIEELGERLELHRLALEDTLHIPQRPKLDDYETHEYLVARMPVSTHTLETEQLSVFLAKGFVLTVQEQPGDCFDGIRERIRAGRVRIRESGTDYLFYAVLDAVVDAYFPLLESIGDELEELEDSVTTDQGQDPLHDLTRLKRDLVILRRYLRPLRELTTVLIREDSTFLTPKSRVFMRDCHDHAAYAVDLSESYRDIAAGLLDLHLSLAGQRMNEVMKVLTIIATIFIPLSFFAGLYGMNFDPSASKWNMPELSWAYGYPAALGLMLACAVGMIGFFWKRGWFK